MRTIQEIKSHIAATQRNLDKRINAMNERVQEMALRIQGRVSEEALVEKFKNGGRIEQYDWNYEYSLSPSRRCFVSNKLILPGRQAYKGTWTVGKIITSEHSPEIAVYPTEIWLTKEEFTMRRLKGQI